MRCKRTRVYDWPDHRPPYNGRPIEAMKVSAPSQRGASHYAYWDRHGFGEALCGFTFTREDGVTAIAGEPSCPECVGEKRLAEEMRPG
jgi:hypothetical protein